MNGADRPYADRAGPVSQSDTLTIQEDRFAFGANWREFLTLVDDRRVKAARDSLCEMLAVASLAGRSFLDLGSGSGLFSLAARELGASVLSVDLDSASVACTAELRRRYRPGDRDWRVVQGSVLDKDHMASFGRFDVVYSWGVLHHTGAMWRALDLTIDRLGANGSLFIAIYNDQGRVSDLWRSVKRTYVRSGPTGRRILVTAAGAYFTGREIPGRMAATLRGRRLSQSEPPRARGMDRKRDLIDWVGGYPFEVATPAAVIQRCRDRGLSLVKVVENGGLGCNEFVFCAGDSNPAASC